MQVSVTLSCQQDTVYSPFPASAFEEGLHWARELGFSGVELAIARPDLMDADRLSRQLAGACMKATTISTGQIVSLEQVHLSHPDLAKRRRALDILCRHVDLSEQIGHPPITIGLLRGTKQDMPADRQVSLFAESLAFAADYARVRGVSLSIEPINRYEIPFLHSADDVLSFLQSIGNPRNVGVLYDTYHSNIEDADMFDAIRALQGRITNVHLSDSNRLLPGQGHLAFQRILETLQEIGYKGTFALECFFPADIDSVSYQTRNALSWIKSYSEG